MTEDTGGETPRHAIRIPDARWDRFGELAKADGSNISEKINRYMQSEIDRASRKKAKA